MSQGKPSQIKRTAFLQKSKRKSSPTRDASFDRKYEFAVKCYQNYMEGLHLVLKEKERTMLKILRKRSSPLWFQELTDEQCLVCDQMLDAIGDDLDEGTFHRSKELLLKLGVYPICPNRIMRTALILCNRNDISFLWLLLELYYIRRHVNKQTDHEADYSSSERLLLSSIAHLDMLTTLRGLDTILPARKRHNSNQTGKKMDDKKRIPGEFPKLSPYSKRLVVHKTGYTAPLNIHLHRDEFLERYARYRDPTFIIRNEESRWFARCSGSGRNLFSSKGYITVSEEVTESVIETESFDSAYAVVKALLDENIKDMIDRVECCQMLCPRHHQLSKEGTNLLLGLQQSTAVREALLASARSQCARWKEAELQSDGKRQVENLLRRLIDEAVSLAVLEPVENCPECSQRFEMQQKLRAGEKCVCAATSTDSVSGTGPSIEEAKPQYFKLCMDASHHLYEFDHGKIFDDEMQQKEALTCPIKSAIRRTLQVGNESGNVDIDQAIENFVRNTWQIELKQQKQRMLEEKQKQKQQPQSKEPDLLDMEYIDIKDMKVLQNLLKRALRRLAERPMYILATFPDVDRLPILRAWIRDRYGVPIGPQERAATLLESKIFWNTIVPRATAIRWPSRKDTGLKSTIDWSYKTKLEPLVTKLMYRFDRRVKSVQVQEGRLWWTTMVPYHAGVDRFRRTFSAYFPNCEAMMVPAMRPCPAYRYRAIPSTVKGTKC